MFIFYILFLNFYHFFVFITFLFTVVGSHISLVNTMLFLLFYFLVFIFVNNTVACTKAQFYTTLPKNQRNLDIVIYKRPVFVHT